jgi:dolichyl-diphosphooligosaccharide--protein glycosyltransferase
MTIKDSLKKFFIEESKVETVSESKEIDIKLLKIPIKNKNLLYWLSLIPVFFIALYVRTRNLPLLQGKYLIELDSYFYFNYAKTILEKGSLPAIDMMRYAPWGMSTSGLSFFPKTMVFFYKIAHLFFSNLSQIEWHVIYPPVITVLSFVFFFLFVKEALNHRAAFVATAFLAVIPAYIQRTMAGFADHEAMATLWMFISLWLFVLAWKSNDSKAYPFVILSGIFAAAGFATWGGGLYVPLTLGLFLLVTFFLTTIKKKQLFLAACWLAPYWIMYNLFKFGSLASFSGRDILIWVFILLLFAVHLFVSGKIKFSKIPTQLTSFFLTVGISLGIGLPLKLIPVQQLIDTINGLTSIGNRWASTVAESAQPYFSDWWGSFGFGLIFMLIGCAVAIYILSDTKDKVFKSANLAAYLTAIIAFIFGRFAGGGTITTFFSNTFIYWLFFAGTLVALGYLWLFYKNRDEFNKLQNNYNANVALIILFFAISLIASRSSIRLLHMLAPAGAIMIGFFTAEATKDRSKINRKLIAFVVILLVGAVFILSMQTSLQQNEYSGSMVPGQWGDAMNWVRENTPENSVFAHWWDYGYLTQTVGQRASVTDGGNILPWNHQSGRYLLTGEDENSTLTYLKTHNVTHILISEEEIPKYPAFSLIGSDESLDRYSSIGVFALQSTKEVRNGTLLLYGGSWGLDKDYLVSNIILPEGQAGIYGFAVPSDLNSQTPQAYVSYNNQQYIFDIPCIAKDGQRTNFETSPNSTLNGCLVLIPYIQDQNNVNDVGAAFWASEKVWDTNFARLYLYNEKDLNFKLIYKDNMPLALYQGRIIGPIKIWEVNYPENIKSDEFYLQFSEYG